MKNTKILSFLFLVLCELNSLNCYAQRNARDTESFSKLIFSKADGLSTETKALQNSFLQNELKDVRKKFKGDSQKVAKAEQEIKQFYQQLDSIGSDNNSRLLVGSKRLLDSLAVVSKLLQGTVSPGFINGQKKLEQQVQRFESVHKLLHERVKFLHSTNSGLASSTKVLKPYLEKLTSAKVRYQKIKGQLTSSAFWRKEVINKFAKNSAFQEAFQLLSSKNTMSSSWTNNLGSTQLFSGEVSPELAVRLLSTLEKRVDQLGQRQVLEAVGVPISAINRNIAQGRSQFAKMRAASLDSKTKDNATRLKRDFTIQTNPANNLLPMITDIGCSVGWPISKSTIVGIGINAKLGLGYPVRDVSFSYQGLRYQTYFSIKWKKNWWLYTSYEISNFPKLQERLPFSGSIQQNSFLGGLERRLKINGRTQSCILLYDFLAARQIPYNQPIKFRLTHQL